MGPAAEGADPTTWVGAAVVDSSAENGPPHADRSTGDAAPPHSDGSSGRADGGGMGEITGMEDVVFYSKYSRSGCAFSNRNHKC